MKQIYSERTTCRVCGSDELLPVLSLGNQYIINFPEGDAPDTGIRAPLDMVLCANTECSLAQLRHTVEPDLLYRQFWYKSGINQTMRDALADVTRSAQQRVQLGKGDIVVDIGSNDSTLLRTYAVDGLYTVGFEPATNLMTEARERTSLIVNDYFNGASFQQHLPGKQARVVTSIAMFYDLEDPNAFVRDIKSILATDGVWINQMNYLGTMLSKNAFDNISHEHLEYYSLSSLEFLLARHGLEVFDAELNNLNGGSIRAYISHVGAHPVHERVRELRRSEGHLKTFDPYREFVARLEDIKQRICSFIDGERAAGKKIYVYGASTRGNTLLQYFGLNDKVITAAAERNPVKWGKRMVGTNVPIVSEDEARKAKPDYFLVLPWAFIREFLAREKEFLQGGGRFIVPLSEFRVLSIKDA
jgi:NDP-4-keto-2,6-dideoxyhexose 3-C-methyltransferase